MRRNIMGLHLALMGALLPCVLARGGPRRIATPRSQNVASLDQRDVPSDPGYLRTRLRISHDRSSTEKHRALVDDFLPRLCQLLRQS